MTRPAPSNLSLDDILMPLAIAVVIDQKVRPVERTAFAELANGLLELFGHETMPRQALLDWFAASKDDLEDQLWDKGGNTLVLQALTRFTKPAHCEAVYDALVSIAVADREYVTEESRLIKSASAIYGYPRPPLKVTRS
ncbi:TerB family tellurite resistance protein [uncultured Algimonas sp.]|uniref:TerB family tellurite resistance protein n=1 Tax=uncultured Algimonas sp. TaxID=1547920 RepID=UPI002611E150|nr:TerB family tellurite resistance protein [uncultured Algimonas sp.]